MTKSRSLYALFVAIVLASLIGAAGPIAASDLFRQPYSSGWDVIHRILDRLQLSYNPSGGGAPPQFPYWRDPADAWLYYRNVTLHTADDLKLTAWYVPAIETGARTEKDTRPAVTVLLAHGLLDSKHTMLQLVPWLHSAGHNVLLFDFRGHGESDRQPTTVGRLEALDVWAALDWLDAEGAGERVVGLGMSLGAAALVNAAAEDDRLDGLILDALFADWSDVDYASEYRLSPDWLVPDVPAPVDLLPSLHIPVLIIHGTADILTHVEHAYRLYEAANDPKELWINDSGHAWAAWTYPDLYQEKVLQFIELATQ